MSKKTKRKLKKLFNFGKIKADQAKVLLPLLIMNVFMTSAVVLHYIKPEQHKIETPVSLDTKRNKELEADIKSMVRGYPIEQMVPFIANQDKEVAAFMVAIAKKESAWGKRKPVLDGEDCYNYWGFRLKTEKMGSGGHTCFDNPEQAVKTVASRIDELVKKEKVDNAKKMIVWKCGYDCASKPKSESEKKWIKDVNYYYELLN